MDTHRARTHRPWRFLAGAAVALAVFGTRADTAEDTAAPEVEELRAWRADLASPARLALGADGTVYVSDPGRGQVVARAPDGRVLWRRTGLGQPVGLAVDTSGNLLVANTADGSVTAWDLATWTATYRLGVGPGELGKPLDIAVAPATGRIYVVDALGDQVRIYAPGGALVGAFGALGSEVGQFDSPVALDVDPVNGELWVVDQRNRRVQVFDPNGAFLRTFGEYGDEGLQFQAPQGIWLDDEGRAWVADAVRGRVFVFDHAGDPLADVGEYGTARGQLRQPVDVLIDGEGRLLVASGNNGRLEIFGVDDFEDDERYAPASVAIDAPVVGAAQPLRVRIEVPGYRLDAVVLTSVAANGVVATTVSEGDEDHDGEPELLAEFDGAALVASLAGAEHVVFTGQMETLSFRSEEIAVDVIIGDTDDSGDTDGHQSGDTSGDTSGDEGDPDGRPSAGEPGGCGCATGGPSPALPFLALALARRRRRAAA